MGVRGSAEVREGEEALLYFIEYLASSLGLHPLDSNSKQ